MTRTFLTTSFSTSSSVYDSSANAPRPVQTFSAEQIAAARKAMALVSAYTNVTFTEVNDSTTLAGDIRWGQSGNGTAVKTAYAYYPSTHPAAGDIWIGPNYDSYRHPVEGGDGFYTFIHELGHALGLNHTHDGVVPTPAGEDQYKYSIMSYRDFAGDDLGGINSAYLPTTYMLNDIRALQFLYGTNMSYRTGNDVYQWASDKSVYETIWDAGGNDTLSASNQAQSVVLNLNSGQWSEIGKAFWNSQAMVRNNLTIAYGATIENAIGSAYNDQLIGNAVANMLNGGAGNDTINGGAGNDVLTGGTGQDAFVFDTAPGTTVNSDKIIDFTVVDDVIQLSHAIYDALVTVGTLASDFFRIGAAADNDDYILYDSTTGAVSYDADGAGANTAVMFAELTAGLALTNADFWVA